MDLTIALLGLALYLLVWEKLPDWGTWFNRGLARLPRPLQTLYEQWGCAYCVGFWLALALHGITGLWTLPVLAEMPAYWTGAPPGAAGGGAAAGGLVGWLALLTAWFLDGLAGATLIYVAKNALDAIRLPAMRANMMRPDYYRFHEDQAAKKREE